MATKSLEQQFREESALEIADMWYEVFAQQYVTKECFDPMAIFKKKLEAAAAALRHFGKYELAAFLVGEKE